MCVSVQEGFLSGKKTFGNELSLVAWKTEVVTYDLLSEAF